MNHSITESFASAQKIIIYNSGTQTALIKGDEKFEQVLSALQEISAGAFDMPAFGVSLDKETKNEMQSGIWMELCFDKVMQFNEMNFESLLIKVEKSHSGFNLIRSMGGKYEGRCFYLNLNGDMSKLFDKICEILK